MDGSLEILQRFERRGQLTLLQEVVQTHDQAVWVTRMARMAAAMGADWVINSDADEFWWPQQGNLTPPWPSSPRAWKSAGRAHQLSATTTKARSAPLYQRQTLRERVSATVGGPYKADSSRPSRRGDHRRKPWCAKWQAIEGSTARDRDPACTHSQLHSSTQIRQGTDPARNKRVGRASATAGARSTPITCVREPSGVLRQLASQPCRNHKQPVRGALIDHRRLQKPSAIPRPGWP